jgi:hypothetical protein
MSQPATVVDMPTQANDDIAVVGFSFRLPQDLNDDMSFWEALDNRRNLMTSCPKDRMNARSLLDTNASKVRLLLCLATWLYVRSVRSRHNNLPLVTIAVCSGSPLHHRRCRLLRCSFLLGNSEGGCGDGPDAAHDPGDCIPSL